MKNMCFLSRWLLNVLLFFGLTAAAGTAQSPHGTGTVRVEDLAVLALDPAEGRAILQLPDGSLRSVAAGEELREARIRVRAVLADRLVAEDAGGAGKARRQIWIFRARTGERSRVQVLDRERPARPPILKPQSMAPEKDSGNG